MEIESLLKRARLGDSAAEKQLFEVLTARFRIIARRRLREGESPEDVVQDALLVVSSEYRTVNTESGIGAWAHGVLMNRVRRAWQERQRESYRVAAAKVTPVSGYMGGIELDPEIRRRLIECMRKLCSRNRQYARALNLCHQGFATEEICARLEVRSANLYSMLSRARALLRACVEVGELVAR